MGSRAVVLVCRDAAAGARGSASRRAGRSTPAPAGRSSARAVDERRCSTGSAAAVDAAGLWDELGTDWLLLDAELLPWSAKASRADPRAVRERSARPAGPRCRPRSRRWRRPRRGSTWASCERGSARRGSAIARRSPTRTGGTAGRPTGWTGCGWRRSRCWPAEGRSHAPGPRLAPGAGGPAGARPTRSCSPPTRRLVVDLARPADVAAATEWWLELTGAGGEGMVVKP